MSRLPEVDAGPVPRRRARYLLPVLLGVCSSGAVSGVAALALRAITLDSSASLEPAATETTHGTSADREDDGLAGDDGAGWPDPPVEASNPVASASPEQPVGMEPGADAPPSAPSADSTPNTPAQRPRPSRRATTPAEEPAVAEVAAPLDMSPRARAYREVQRADDGAVEIPRDVLMALAYDEALMRAQARRVTPWFEDGECRGVRVEGAGPLLQLVGVLDGDVITHAGGIVIDSPHRGLAAWDALRERSEISLGLVRNGRRFTQRYRLVEPAQADQ